MAKLQIEVGDKTVDLIDGLAKFLKVAKEVSEDGFQPGQDLPVLGMTAFQELLPVVSALQEVKAEFEANPDSRTIAAALLANELMDIF